MCTMLGKKYFVFLPFLGEKMAVIEVASMKNQGW